MRITGIIYSVDLKNRILSINRHNRIVFFYLSNNLMKKFKKYLYAGNLITFTYEDELNVKALHTVHKILFIEEISVPGRYGKDILYSKKETSGELGVFLDNLDYLLFLDIEMSMPPFGKKVPFTSEIIQAGLLLVNKKGEIVEKHNYYIKPRKHKYLTDRTVEFLGIDYEFIKANGITYYKFYNKFKNVINKFQPAVVVFGKNDKLFLERSYITNELPSLTFMTRFVNLSQLIKNYYELGEDPGLFNIYRQLCSADIDNQKHDALEDALVTYNVYKSFKEEVCSNKKLESVI